MGKDEQAEKSNNLAYAAMQTVQAVLSRFQFDSTNCYSSRRKPRLLSGENHVLSLELEHTVLTFWHISLTMETDSNTEPASYSAPTLSIRTLSELPGNEELFASWKSKLGKQINKKKFPCLTTVLCAGRDGTVEDHVFLSCREALSYGLRFLGFFVSAACCTAGANLTVKLLGAGDISILRYADSST